jgi:hypothetical protein
VGILGRQAQRQKTICANAGTSRAMLGCYAGKLLVGKVEESIVDDDEVIPRSVHFGKFENKALAHVYLH